MQTQHNQDQTTVLPTTTLEIIPSADLTAAEIAKIKRVVKTYHYMNMWADEQDLDSVANVTIAEVWHRYASRIERDRVVDYMRRVVDNALRDYVLKEKAPCSIPKRPTRDWFLKNPLHRSGTRAMSNVAVDGDRKIEDGTVRAKFWAVQARIYEVLPPKDTEEATINEQWDVKVRNRILFIVDDQEIGVFGHAVKDVLLNESDVKTAAKQFGHEPKALQGCISAVRRELRADPVLQLLMAEKIGRTTHESDE